MNFLRTSGFASGTAGLALICNAPLETNGPPRLRSLWMQTSKGQILEGQDPTQLRRNNFPLAPQKAMPGTCTAATSLEDKQSSQESRSQEIAQTSVTLCCTQAELPGAKSEWIWRGQRSAGIALALETARATLTKACQPGCLHSGSELLWPLAVHFANAKTWKSVVANTRNSKRRKHFCCLLPGNCQPRPATREMICLLTVTPAPSTLRIMSLIGGLWGRTLETVWPTCIFRDGLTVGLHPKCKCDLKGNAFTSTSNISQPAQHSHRSPSSVGSAKKNTLHLCPTACNTPKHFKAHSACYLGHASRAVGHQAETCAQPGMSSMAPGCKSHLLVSD